MLNKMLQKDIVIPYEYLSNIKISLGGYTITLEEFLEMKIKMIMEEINNE